MKENIILNIKHERIHLEKIKNKNDWEKGFDQGYPFFKEGEELKKEGKLEEALKLFDEARYLGYNAPALYEAYADVFEDRNELDDQIYILNEGLTRINDYGASKDEVEKEFKKRIKKAVKLRKKQA